MAIQRTLSIIKPDGVKNQNIGKILARLEAKGLRLVALKMIHMDRELAEEFYGVHKERPFFKDLVQFITSGPVVVSVLEGSEAIATYRELMGATDPKKAAPGTIRADFSKSIDENTVHGSDAPETARNEISLMFPELV